MSNVMQSLSEIKNYRWPMHLSTSSQWGLLPASCGHGGLQGWMLGNGRGGRKTTGLSLRRLAQRLVPGCCSVTFVVKWMNLFRTTILSVILMFPSPDFLCKCYSKFLVRRSDIVFYGMYKYHKRDWENLSLKERKIKCKPSFFMK